VNQPHEPYHGTMSTKPIQEKRNQKRRKILLDAARSVLAYVQRAGIQDDKDGPLFRPMTPDATRLIRRPLDRKTPWRLVKKYCRAAGIDPSRLGGCGMSLVRHQGPDATTYLSLWWSGDGK
jgi:hypothetical protein